MARHVQAKWQGEAKSSLSTKTKGFKMCKSGMTKNGALRLSCFVTADGRRQTSIVATTEALSRGSSVGRKGIVVRTGFGMAVMTVGVVRT